MCYENTWDQTLSWNSDVHSLNIHVVSASFLAPWSRLSSLGDNWPLYTSIELQWSGITCLLSMRNCYHQLSWSLMPHQNPWDTLNSLGYGWEYKKMCERTRPGLRTNCDIGRLVGMNARRVVCHDGHVTNLWRSMTPRSRGSPFAFRASGSRYMRTPCDGNLSGIEC